MKKLNFLYLILIGFIFFTCSSDNNSTQESESEEVVRVFKRSETFNNGNLISDKTLEYTSDNKIQSITTNNYGSSTRTITVNYSSGIISTITVFSSFDNPNSADEDFTYNVAIGNNKIILTSDSTSEIEIGHSQGYVDSVIATNSSLPNEPFEQVYTRDSELNLTSNASRTFRDFDSDKMVSPIGLTNVPEYYLSDLFKIFNLKVTDSNPSEADFNYGPDIYTYYEDLEYDELGYVISTRRTSNANFIITKYTEYKYVEL